MDDNEKVLRIEDVLAQLALNKKMIALIVGVSLFLSAFYLVMATPKYRSEMVVGPPRVTENINPLGGLSALVGGLSGGSSSPEFYLFEEMLSSRRLADQLARDDELMHVIFKDYWDESAKSWHPVKGLSGWLASVFGLYNKYYPSGALLHEYLKRELVISETKGGVFLRLSLENEDADFASGMLQKIHLVADDLVSEKKRIEQELLVAFLAEKLDDVSRSEQKQSLADLLAQEERTLILLGLDLPYAAIIIDGPTVPDRYSSPNVVKTLVLGFLLGMVLSLLLLVIPSRFRK